MKHNETLDFVDEHVDLVACFFVAPKTLYYFCGVQKSTVCDSTVVTGYHESQLRPHVLH